MKILIVEDDEKNREFLKKGLLQEGYAVDEAKDGEIALDLICSSQFDLIILDIMLPNLSGMQILETMRSKSITIPTLVLSAKQNSAEKIEALKIGADDFLSKPYSFAELVARIEALLRRAQPIKIDQLLQYENISLNPATRTVFIAERSIELPNKEYLLLSLLLRNAERIISKNYILDQIWNLDFDPQTGVVDVLVSRLRSKLETILKVNLIHTVRGAGYVLKKD